MFRTRLAIGLTAVALLGISACGGDGVADKIEGAATETTVSGDDDTATNDTAAPGVTAGGDASAGVAGMVPEECRAIYGQIIGAMAAAMSPGAEIDVDGVFGAAKEKVPDELKGDIETLADALGTMSEKFKENPNDPSAIAQVMAVLSTEEVAAASDRINAYFDETCPE